MTDEPIRLLIVDDHTSSRSALAMLLDRLPNMTVVAEAGGVQEARNALAVATVDIVLLDMHLADGTGRDVMAILRAGHPHAATIVLSGDNSPQTRALAVAAGAVGVLHKSVDLQTIIQTIEKACDGALLISRPELVSLMNQAEDYLDRERRSLAAIGSLTVREREVLQALAEGLDNKAIAAQLHLSVDTIRTHVARILEKLHVDSRLHAVVLAIRQGWVNLNDGNDR